MTPNREEWLRWRKQGIGSSDAPIIMGVSPYATPRQLYEDKINPESVDEEESNFVMNIGNEMEPRARNHFAALYSIENQVDEPFSAKLVQMAAFPFIRASLDGCSQCEKKILEIKYQGADPHQAVIDHGLIPEKYYPQVQHGLMASGADVSYFVSINTQFDVRWIQTTPNIAYIKKMLEAEMKFWSHVVQRIPPPLVDGDFKSLRYKGATEDARAWLSGSHEAEKRILEAASNAKGKFFKLKGVRITDGKLETYNG